MKKYLFVLSQAPHSGHNVQETLDVILTTAAFDQPVALLLLDDGVFQLKKGQNPELLGLKDTLSVFKALEIYDVDDIYIEVESLHERGLKPADMALAVRELYRKDVSGFMKQYDVIYSA